MKPAEYIKRLRSVRDFILTQERSAREIAEHIHCTPMTAYALVNALREHGAVLQTGSKRVGERGPEAQTYKLKKPLSIKSA